MLDVLLNNLLPFVLLITLLVGLHELGHYLAARALGVRVSEFAIGFGPILTSRKRSNGERWSLRWLPLGGFVKFTPAAERPLDAGPRNEDSFETASLAKQLPILLAGPLANVVVFLLVTGLLFWVHGQPVHLAQVDSFTEQSAGREAGLELGDRIVSVNGTHVRSMGEVAQLVSVTKDEVVTLEVERDRSLLSYDVSTHVVAQEGHRGRVFERRMLGIISESHENKRYSGLGAFTEAARDGYFKTRGMILVIVDVITGERPLATFSGPVGIADVTGLHVGSFYLYLSFLALVSLNLAIVNLLPFPPFDGGQILVRGTSAIFGRANMRLFENVLAASGGILLIFLVIYLTYQDIIIILSTI